ncbi:hypothetical protein NC653_028077 [Populus alba x Populus x berolinensis]|uniref:ABC transporter domain-containing protein n=1 Tax=Populus alba x Populus x berolinensis TaxID=444605 RepID=A0AAD6M7I0_9ROSI|nr:hypothetical protein NC653_028077 [Populus alba x Populus x berolinensis]
MGASTRIFQTIDRTPSIDSEDKKGKALSYVRGEIDFQDIHSSYPSRPDTPILQGLNLRIPASKTGGLVGGSSSGKATIFGLFERFYDPMKQAVFINRQDIKSFNLRILRSHIALVSQEPTLFAGTIRENIACGKEDARESEIQKAAVVANAH